MRSQPFDTYWSSVRWLARLAQNGQPLRLVLFGGLNQLPPHFATSMLVGNGPVGYVTSRLVVQTESREDNVVLAVLMLTRSAS